MQARFQDDTSELYYFFYNNIRYPFNIIIFNTTSKYFSKNEDKKSENHIIKLIDEFSEGNIKFTDESIQNFVDYSQRKQIIINNKNVVSLNYLSKKYEIDSLFKLTDQYINENHDKIILELLSINQFNKNFNYQSYECIISDHLEEYINNELMLTLNIPILYRILGQFHEKEKNEKLPIISYDICEFLLKCLSEYGRPASILFSFTDTIKLNPKQISRLFDEYSNIFDFHFINSSCLKTIYDIQTEMMKNEKQERDDQNEEIAKLKLEMQQIKTNFIEDKEKKDKSIIELKDDITKLKQNMKKLEDELFLSRQYIHELCDYIINLQESQNEHNHQIYINQNKLKKYRKETNQFMSDLFMDDLQTFNKKSADVQILFLLFNRSFNENDDEKVIYLLNYLINVDKKSKAINLLPENCWQLQPKINIYKPSGQISYSKICICHEMIEKLFEKNLLKSNEFTDHINGFTDFYFEIKYPSYNFDDIYDQIVDIKHSRQDKVKILILITKIDSKFYQNKEINHITFDISNNFEIDKFDEFDECDRQFYKECSSLESISFASFHKNKIPISAFDGCSSLTKIITSYTTAPDSISNIDDYEIEKFIEFSFACEIFKGKNKKTGQEVVIRSCSLSHSVSDRINFMSSMVISQINHPGILKSKSIRYPLTNKEKQIFKLQKYELKDSKGKTEKSTIIDLTGYITISEFMKYGNLRENTKSYLNSSIGNPNMNPTIRCKIIFGIAAIMKSLHKKKIVHRNLSDTKIFLDDRLEPRIELFTLSRFIDDPFELEMAVGIPYFMAPETFMDGDDPYSFPVDVYSYAIILYKMFSSQLSFSDNKPIRSPQQYMMNIGRGNRPKRPALIPDHYWELINDCWKQDPSERPTFEEIINRLKNEKYTLEEFGMKTNMEQLLEYQQRIDVD